MMRHTLAALIVLGTWLEILGWVSEDTQVRRPGRGAEIARAVETARFGARDLQVHIDTRFISVDPGFLEDVGVDLSFSFVPPGGELIRPVSTQKIAEGPGFFTQRSTFQSPGLIDLIDQSYLATAIKLSRAGEPQLEDILCLLRTRATDSVLSAPKVVLLSGQTHVIRSITAKQYTVNMVGDGDSKDEADKVVADLEGIPLGTVFYVGSNVSPSKRHVLVILSPQVCIYPSFPPDWENALKGSGLSRDATGRDPHHIKRPPESTPHVDSVDPATRR